MDKPQTKIIKLKCPECGEFSLEFEWKETEVGCELCGTHDAITCPKCLEPFDLVHGSKEEIRMTI